MSHTRVTHEVGTDNGRYWSDLCVQQKIAKTSVLLKINRTGQLLGWAQIKRYESGKVYYLNLISRHFVQTFYFSQPPLIFFITHYEDNEGIFILVLFPHKSNMEIAKTCKSSSDIRISRTVASINGYKNHTRPAKFVSVTKSSEAVIAANPLRPIKAAIWPKLPNRIAHCYGSDNSRNFVCIKPRID